jgi:hypothetical protein
MPQAEHHGFLSLRVTGRSAEVIHAANLRARAVWSSSSTANRIFDDGGHAAKSSAYGDAELLLLLLVLDCRARATASATLLIIIFISAVSWTIATAAVLDSGHPSTEQPRRCRRS